MLVHAEVNDLTKPRKDLAAYILVLLLLNIEARDKFDGKVTRAGAEIVKAFTDITLCTREIVNFFHHRIPCDCLKEL